VALGHADLDESVLAAGDCALDKHEVLLSIDADDLEVLDGDALCPCGRPCAGPCGRARDMRTGRWSQARAGCGSRGPWDRGEKFQRLMVPWKPLPLDVPMTSTALTSAKSATVTVAAVELLAVLDADLAQVAHGLHASLGEVTCHGLVDVLLLDVTKADLDGVIAVGRLGL
jgi:hypothetical protein